MAPTTPIAYQPGERGEISRRDDHNHRQTDGDEKRNLRNAMPIKSHELSRHFLVPRHHVDQTDHGDDGGVSRTEQEKEKNDADNPAKHFAKSRPETDGAKYSPMKRNMSSLCAYREPRIELLIESMAQPSSAVATTTSIATGQIALDASRPTRGSAMVAPFPTSSRR